jgi:fatty acid desaturase
MDRAMQTSLRLDRAQGAPAADAPPRPPRMLDDKAMLRTAADLTRELNTLRPAIYWSDLAASCVVGYGALAAAFLAPSLGWTIVAGVVAVLGLYRAMSFIHELTHIKHAALPGFRLVWNAVVGVPLLIPSFMYEGVHNLHHARTRYGTADDPEYLPLALMKPWSLPLFIVVAALAPVALLFRYAILAPLSAIIPPLRRVVVERYSALSINPGFRRRAPEGAFKAQWTRTEIAASLWAIALIALVVSGVMPLRWFVIVLLVASGVALLNQLRTLVAHLWENEGEAMSVTAQYLDTVNVPPPATLPVLWAPVGLRYHALHHLLPGLPYHALGEAHRRITRAFEPGSPYHKASYAGMFGLVVKIGRSTMVARR